MAADKKETTKKASTKKESKKLDSLPDLFEFVRTLGKEKPQTK